MVVVVVAFLHPHTQAAYGHGGVRLQLPTSPSRGVMGRLYQIGYRQVQSHSVKIQQLASMIANGTGYSRYSSAVNILERLTSLSNVLYTWW